MLSTTHSNVALTPTGTVRFAIYLIDVVFLLGLIFNPQLSGSSSKNRLNQEIKAYFPTTLINSEILKSTPMAPERYQFEFYKSCNC